MRGVSTLCASCGAIVRPGARCSCKPNASRPKRSRQERGYGANHTRARKQLKDLLERRGMVRCFYCPVVIRNGEKWVAAHIVDGDPSKGWAIAHPVCNERAKVRKGRNDG